MVPLFVRETMNDIEMVVEAGNGIILDSFMKARSVLESHRHAVVSVSGGGRF